MRTRIASSVRRDEGGAPPMFSASRTPRTAIALSDITNNLVDTKPDLSAGKKKVPAGAHQRAPSNKAKPSKAAAATASDAKPVKPVEPVELLKLGKPEKSSGVDAVAADDDSLHASTHSSDGDLHEAGHRLDALTTSDNEGEEDKSPLGSDSGGPETESDHLQQPLKKHTSQTSSNRQVNDTPDDLSDRSEDNLPLPSGRGKKAARISDLDVHLEDLSDDDSPIKGADQPLTPRPSGRATGSFRPREDDPAVILAALGIPATPHVVQIAQGLLEDPDMEERPGLLRYHITHSRMIEALLKEMTKLKEAVAKLSVTDLKICASFRKRQNRLFRKKETDYLAKTRTVGDSVRRRYGPRFLWAPRSFCAIGMQRRSSLHARSQEALLRFGTVTRGIWDSNLEFQTEALSIFSTALATARSDLHKLIGRVQRKEVDMLRAMQSWYKDNPTTYTDERLAWCGFATTLAKKAAQRFYHARYCPNGAFDCSIFLYRTVVSQFYDADTSPMTTRPKVSTMDSTCQTLCTTVITTCQPVADFQRLVLLYQQNCWIAYGDVSNTRIYMGLLREPPFDRRGTRPASSKLARLRSTTLLHEFARGLRARKPTGASGGHPMGAMNFTQRCVAVPSARPASTGNAAGQVRLEDGDDGAEVGMCGGSLCLLFSLVFFSRARIRPRCTATPTGVLFFVFSLFG
ncbi:BQ5605_C002g01321 [Microbotryum silenes-dioicae]|uniref:BQ5605_C002g01321 protein n=1 Tax=Microbotryum silenes-dioicae TaxID=796604 RepID=A0A2X0M2B8_9BASI|nr:BQ5605_C002g01321 [Microbotryum silenes-dioicae]